MIEQRPPEFEDFETSGLYDPNFIALSRILEMRFADAKHLDGNASDVRYLTLSGDGEQWWAMFALTHNTRALRRGTAEVFEVFVPLDEFDSIDDIQVAHLAGTNIMPRIRFIHHDQGQDIHERAVLINSENYHKQVSDSFELESKLSTYQLVSL